MRHWLSAAAALAVCGLLAACATGGKSAAVEPAPSAALAAASSPVSALVQHPVPTVAAGSFTAPPAAPADHTASVDSVELRFGPIESALPLAVIKPDQLASVIAVWPLADGGKVLLYQTPADNENVYAALQTDTELFAVGPIGYTAQPDQYEVSEVEALHGAYVKIIGACGANCPISAYVRLGQPVPVLLRIEAHTEEVDLDGDGSCEIVASVGTLAETTVYTVVRGEPAVANLNALLHASLVIYNKQSGVFQAQGPQGAASGWRWSKNRLTRVAPAGSQP
ncbi:hypothetical protein B5M42_022490 [Paenibacillus athensensis]|uniref:Lipoprotein n=1 Tax=Paenibacillus athensensis TaxID=1967502 RepID=A0A4Y8PTJ4_9BACL|nr:hypothetical protein [Paenibacillus athensensis]MCD1261575.1 hypothetical protein [Paenibacillus athensensis]